tara:strand:+ start:130 stop:717 length:588 start_codon:yes stop_codon:yes gene_type:complete
MKFIILIICILFSLGLYANPTYKHSHQLYNFYVEIPAGTKQKWEINKDGYLEWEEKKGKKRIVKFLSYPGNYGFIPQTISGDNDPIDVIDLEESVTRGKTVSRKIIGGMYFEDKKDIDIKLIAIDKNGVFKNYETIDELMFEKPEVLEILRLWFLSYKKPGKMVFFRYIGKKESLKIIEDAHKKWKHSKKIIKDS